MEHFIKKKMASNHIWATIVLSIMMIGVLFYFQWVAGVIFTILLIVLFFYVKREEHAIKKDIYHYLENVTYKVENAGKEVFFHLPLGIILYDEEYKIKWANPYMIELNGGDMLLVNHLKFTVKDCLIRFKTEAKKHGFR